MLVTPGYLTIPDALTVTKMIKNAKTSMVTSQVKLWHRSYNKDIPKATVILVKVTSPTRHLRARQTLNASKFTSGNFCAGDIHQTTHTNERGREGPTWVPRVPRGNVNPKTELRSNQSKKHDTDQFPPPAHGVNPDPYLNSARIPPLFRENDHTSVQLSFERER